MSQNVAFIVVLSILLILVGGPCAFGGPGDGTILGATKVVDHGPDNERWTLVVVAEGFTADQQARFDFLVTQLIEDLFVFPPFDTLQPTINIWRFNVASNDSGADMNPGCSLPESYVNTYFNGSFCNAEIERLVIVDDWLVYDALDAAIPYWDQAVVLVNSNVYGGSGGGISVVSVTSGWQSTVIHELGHSAFGLADEYEYWAGCGIDTEQDYHPAYEPSAPNVTIQTVRELIKWNNFILPETPIPTTTVYNCEQCDSRSNYFPQRTVGLFEGADYYHCSCYRPEFFCMMRDQTPFFCAVCQRAAVASFAPYMPPAFVASPRNAPLALTTAFTYDSPLPANQWHWYFGDGDSSVTQSPIHSYGPGAYDVTLHVNTNWGDRVVVEEDYIEVWADTLVAPELEVEPNTAGYWELIGTNAIPLHEIVIPITMTNVMNLFFLDSISVVGTRAAGFESNQAVFDNKFSGQLAVRLRADAGGGSPPLPPGHGPVARVHFRVRPFAVPGDTSYISTPPLSTYSLKHIGNAAVFQPVWQGATLRVIPPCPCAHQGDLDARGAIDAVDLALEIDIVFFGGADIQDPSCPATRADFNADSTADAVDLAFLIDHVFFGGDPPADPCP